MSEAHCATLGAMRRNALRYASLIAPYNFYNSKNSKPQHPQPPPHIDQRGERGGDVGVGRGGEHAARGRKIAGDKIAPARERRQRLAEARVELDRQRYEV